MGENCLHDPAVPDEITISTRERLIAAATAAFTAKGYANVGVREIATGAGCNFTLIRRFFGSKEGLFRECLERALDYDSLQFNDRENFGYNVSRYFIGSERTSTSLPMLILSMSDPKSKNVCLQLFEEKIIDAVAAWIGGPHAAEKAARIAMVTSGYTIYTSIMPLESLRDRQASGVAWLERLLQAIVDEDIDP